MEERIVPCYRRVQMSGKEERLTSYVAVVDTG